MALTRSKRLKRKAKEKPPAQFPKVINPHVFDPSGLTPSTCLTCGQTPSHKLHIKRHMYVANYSSKLLRCMCGLHQNHDIHGGV